MIWNGFLFTIGALLALVALGAVLLLTLATIGGVQVRRERQAREAENQRRQAENRQRLDHQRNTEWWEQHDPDHQLASTVDRRLATTVEHRPARAPVRKRAWFELFVCYVIGFWIVLAILQSLGIVDLSQKVPRQPGTYQRAPQK